MLVTSNRIDIKIDKKQVGHYIGYDVDYKLPARISSLIDEHVENAHYLIEPSYSYVIRVIEWAQGSITFVKGSIIFKSQIVARLLEQCTRLQCSW